MPDTDLYSGQKYAFEQIQQAALPWFDYAEPGDTDFRQLIFTQLSG